MQPSQNAVLSVRAAFLPASQWYPSAFAVGSASSTIGASAARAARAKSVPANGAAAIPKAASFSRRRRSASVVPFERDIRDLLLGNSWELARGDYRSAFRAVKTRRRATG